MNPPDFWLWLARLLILLFTALIAWLTQRSYQMLKVIQPDFNVLLSLPETVARLVMVGICLLLAYLSGLPAAQLGLTVTDLGWSLGLGVAVGLATQTTVNLVTAGAIKVFGRQIYSTWLILNILPRRPIEWLAVALAFIPPIMMEELLFRPLLLGVFAGLLPLWLLIGLTSLVFGWMHQPQGVLGMVVAGLINICFALLFIWSGEVLVTFVAHYTVNMLQVVMAHFQRDWLAAADEG